MKELMNDTTKIMSLERYLVAVDTSFIHVFMYVYISLKEYTEKFIEYYITTWLLRAMLLNLLNVVRN